MSTAALLLLDLIALAAAAGSWGGAGAVAWPLLRSSRRSAAGLALALSGAAVLATLAHVAIVTALAVRGWWFVQEQLAFGAPLAVVGALTASALAVPPLLRCARSTDGAGHPAADAGGGSAAGGSDGLPARAITALVFAALTAGAALVARVVVGYPLTVIAGAVLLAMVVLATGLSHALLTRSRRRVVAGFAGLGAVVLVSAVGVYWLTEIAAPGELSGAHAHGAVALPAAAAAADPDDVSVADLRTPADVEAPVRAFEIHARTAEITLPSGRPAAAWTYDGALPGTPLRVTEGDLIEATLVNDDVEDGVTIHWHGIDLPNGEDGVAGVTQDALAPGESFTYRFVAATPGTYWYHTHQSSAAGVQRGLYGTLVVEPRGGVPEDLDLTVPFHLQGRASLMGDSDVPHAITVEPGTRVRLRLVDTDQLPLFAQLAGVAFRVVAVDAREVAGGPEVEGVSLRLPAGGRIDVAFTMPDAPVTLRRDGGDAVSLTLSPDGSDAVADGAGTWPVLDLLAYGATATAPAAGSGRHLEAEMVLDRSPRILHGLPAYGYTVNGAVAPHIPSIIVDEGTTLRLTVANRSWETHPMHIHGHHVRVISRDGVAAASVLMLDTFDVQPGEIWVVELIADNPGVWMDHCHNLDHAANGMLMSLAYRGVTSPFELGGEHGNKPE
ncbi:multicopper oxidase family protein [Microbacter sp. GSS18]|nr:multicopper oxidase family protein [Microbacter sp. GSS18]